MELCEFAELTCQESGFGILNQRLDSARWHLGSAKKDLEFELKPDALYNDYGDPIAFIERSNTFKITNYSGRTYVVNKAELAAGPVFRPNLRVETGRGRKARLESEIESLEIQIKNYEAQIQEYLFNEFLFGVRISNKFADLHMQMFPCMYQIDEDEAMHTFESHNWAFEGF